MQKDEAKTPRLAWLDNLGEHLDVSLELYHHFTSLHFPSNSLMFLDLVFLLPGGNPDVSLQYGLTSIQ